MTIHTRFESLLSAVIDRGITPEEEAELSDHLRTCPACRSIAAGYRADAASLRAIGFVEPPAWIRSSVLMAASHPRPSPIPSWKVLAAAAAVLLALVGAALAIGAFDRHPSIVEVRPTGSPAASGPRSAEPSVEASVVDVAYLPPLPRCPAPPTAATIPDVTVSIGNGPGLTATLWGAGVTTCSTTRSDDVVPSTPAALLRADPGNRYVLSLPSGWSLLRVAVVDRASTSNAVARVALEPGDRPSRIELPVTAGPGESIVGFDLWITSADQRVIVGLSVAVRVRVSGPTASTAPADGTTAALTLPTGAVTSVAAPDVRSAAIDGARAVELVPEAPARTGGTLTLQDLTTGARTNLATLVATHLFTQAALNGDRSVWVETWRDHPSAPTQDTPGCPDAGTPLRWQITALVISSGRSSVIATGTNRRSAYQGQCADTGSPAIALDGDQLAYTLESANSGQPFGDRVILRDLATGSERTAVTTDGIVEDLHVDQGSLAYRENVDASQGGRLTYGTGRLMVVPAGQASADVIVGKVGLIALRGQRLAWVDPDGAAGNVWTSHADGTGPSEIAAPAHEGLTLKSVAHLAVEAGMVAWSIVATIDRYSGGPDGCCVSMLSVWAPTEPSARFIEGYGSPDLLAIGSGWLVWHTNRDSLTWHDDGTAPDGFHAVSTTDLGSPWR